ncbi:MAG TPA: type II toxin-antitoxin system VapB family antitoxin [Anaeromyxobacteraceae bacterium]|nr:type II toxin-antitoxin system VapB family antitoxin [Anaeromyxobacteraceae bacterium]
MRTTIRIDDHLLAQAKRLAAATGRTLTQVIQDALREVLARRRAPGRRGRVRLRTVSGQGVQPGVDLDDSAALLDLMEPMQGTRYMNRR